MNSIVDRIKPRLVKHAYIEAQDDMDPFEPSKIVNLNTCLEIIDEEAAKVEHCEFAKSNSTTYWYKTECGHYYKNASVQNDEFKFCPYCGRKIKVIE